MIAIPLYLIILSFFWVLNSKAFKKTLNYANAFLLLWCIIPSFAAMSLFEFYEPPFMAHVYIYIMLLVFETSTLFGKKTRIKRLKRHIEPNEHPSTETINWKVLLIISLFCLLVIIPFSITAIRFALSNGYYYLRLRVLNNEMFSARNRIILQDIIQPLMIVTTLAGIYHLVEYGKLKSITIISILDCILYMLTIGNRWLIMEVMFIILTIVVGRYALNIIALLKRNKWVSRIAVVLLGGMVFITLQRSIRGSTGLIYDVYAYFVGSIHLFGLAVGSPTQFALEGSPYLWGAELFGAFIGLVNNLGVAIGNGEIISTTGINDIVQQYYFVSPNTHMNNNITMIYAFLRDCGVIGIVVDTAVLALFYVYLYKRRNRTIYRRLAYVFGLSLIPFLIFEWFYGRTFVLMVFLILIGLDKASPIKVKNKLHR